MHMRLRPSTSDLLNLDGVHYRPIQIDGDAIVLERADQLGITQSLSHEELHALLCAPDTRYFSGHYELAQSLVRQRAPVDLIMELPANVRSKLLWSTAICDAFLELEAKGRVVRTYASVTENTATLEYETKRLNGQAFRDRNIRRAGAEILGRKFPCAKTVLRLIRTYEEHGHDPLALLPGTHRSGNRTARWCHSTEAMISEVIEVYATTQRPTKTQAISETQRRMKKENQRRRNVGLDELVIPSARSLQRRLAGADPYYLYAKRYGVAAANRKFNLFETGVDVVAPLERVEMDENRLDVISLLSPTGILDHLSEKQIEELKGRRWLYTAKDSATKCIVAIRLANTQNAQDAIRTLRDIFHDKTPYAKAANCECAWDQFGGIGTLVTDQGSAFISEEFRAAALSLGVTMHLPPAGLPQMRGSIESFFRTVGHKLMPLLSGRTFFNPVERSDYPSGQLACLSDDDLIRILLTFVVDIYHNEPHGSLYGETPANCWKRLVKEEGALPVPDGLALRKTFGRPLVRKLRGDGVRFAGLSYSCETLRDAFLHSPEREVEIRADLFDIGWIAVRVGDTWHAAICNHRGFDGLTYTDWQEACRALRVKHGKAAVLSEDTVHRAIARISATNRSAMLRMQLTPFHVTDEEVERNERSLHFSLSPPSNAGSTPSLTNDPLNDGLEILPAPGLPTPRATPEKQTPPTQTQRRKWSFDDE